MFLCSILVAVATSLVHISRGQTLDYKLQTTDNVTADYDIVIVVAHDLERVKSIHEGLYNEIRDFLQIDSSGSVLVIPSKLVNGKRVIYSPVFTQYPDYDDLRRFADAGGSGMKKALQLGVKSALIVAAHHPDISPLVTVLGALQALYIPKEAKEMQQKCQSIKRVALFSSANDSAIAKIANAFEVGRTLTRDIEGGDPEQMTPPIIGDLLKESFKDLGVKVEVIDDQDVIQREYPSVAIVNRGCNHIEKYKARVVKLEYTGTGDISKTLLMVGKGVTFDTGGHDIKTSNGMRTMRLDKGGAATVAGFFMILGVLKPKGIKGHGILPLVRNCVGARAYLPSELLRIRSGKIIRIVNVDAEGRVIMLDPLTAMKEIANNGTKNPHLISMATLTYHAKIAHGTGYGTIIGNKVSEKMGHPVRLSNAGDQMGDPLDVSRVRIEDFESNKDRSPYADLLHSPSPPSSKVARGHQIPFAFLNEGAGLLENGLNPAGNNVSIPYTHVDMSSLEIDPVPNARPLVAMAAGLILPET